MSAAIRAGLARSYLFVPGNRPERIAKAHEAGAHAVIVDLEDAVPPDAKDAARDAVAARLSKAQPSIVRINAIDTPWFASDLRLVALPGVAGVMLPKAGGTDDIRAVRAAVGDSVPVFPLIETARGVLRAVAIARAPGVARLVFGSIDLQADLGVRDEDLLVYRAQIVLAARVANTPPPIDGVTTALDDADLLRRDTLRSRELGFGAKLCIHPKQVAIVNACFAPSAAEVAWARRVVDADRASGGAAVAVDGKMIDRPVLLRALALLEEAGAAAPAE